MEQLKNKSSVILFDGVCNFCNSSINFILKRDKRKEFYFAPLQSIAGRELIEKYKIAVPEGPESVILIKEDKVFLKSSAVIEAVKSLGGIYSLASVLKVIPVFIRDFCYSVVARNRYRWFGKRDTCMIPSPEIKSRFLG